jgi:hypothetical protein
MAQFDPNAYGPIVASLLNDVSPAPLDAGQPHEKFRVTLFALTLEKLFAHTGQPVSDLRMAQACLAGLWLRHNFLDDSHSLSQEIETPTGSFWHAILHRREGDFGNSRYWFRRMGPHPIFPALNETAAAAGWPATPRWNPITLVDRVEHAVRSDMNTPAAHLSRTVQQIEWELLFDYSWKQALAEKLIQADCIGIDCR